MAPLVLEGATLGQRHRHYNQLLNDATTNGKTEPAKINYNKTDIENLFNIDIASNNRDVEYILDVLKGEDMLYISRAIKRSHWLFTDTQYAHIIDPVYLHSELFPQMMPKASCKLLLHIRLTLKDESRVEKFFQYIKEKELKTAMKWLPNCSIGLIREIVKEHALDITPDIFARLCRKSSDIFELLIKTLSNKNSLLEYLNAAMFLLSSKPDLYLEALQKYDKFHMPTFKKKQTEILMKRCPKKIIDNFEKYTYCIDIDTFAKSLKKEEIKSFILKQLENKALKSWFDQSNMEFFIKYMPKEEKNELIKLLIERKIETTNVNNDCIVFYNCAMSCPGRGNNANTYRWYKYVPFDVAFPELKKLIRSESNPEERNAMLMILIGNARRKLTNLESLLQYYRERHINEPFRFKVQFVNDFLQKTDPYIYNDKIWTTLDELFRSMEVYIESDNNVQTCIKAIITYKVIHDEPVPVIIEQKFQFDVLKSYQRKLKGGDKEKLFQYLLNICLVKLNDLTISNQAEFDMYVELLKQALDLLKNWNKELADFPALVNKIKDCVKIKKEKEWSTSSLTALYETKKSWRKDVFEASLVLYPSEETYMNALKHGPELLATHKNEVDALRGNDTIRIDKVLRKIRIYWPQSLASNWTAAYRDRLNKPGGHKALVRGLCCLLNQQQLLEFLRKHEPLETKINWVDTDEHQLSLRKNIAQNMHIARPQVTPDAVLSYAKGDYVQFTQPALNSILYNLRSNHSQECIQNLLKGTVSLQKHGIHLAFAKLSTVDMKKILEAVWKTTKNPSMRAVLFYNIHKLLCKEQDEVLLAELWELMQTFINSLTAEEDKIVYNTFGNLAKVHKIIKPKYCMKSYNFLKTCPPKVDCNNVLYKIKEEASNIIEDLDPDFVERIIEEFVDNIIIKNKSGWEHRYEMKILTSYLLSADNENTQAERFEKVFVPLMDKCISSWNNIREGNRNVQENFSAIIQDFIHSTDYPLLKNKVNPSSLYRIILTKLEDKLSIPRNMVLLRLLKLAAAFMDIFHKHKSDSMSLNDKSQLEELYAICAPDIGKAVIQYLKEDYEAYGLISYQPLAKSLDNIFEYMCMSYKTRINCLKYVLNEKDFIPACLLVIQVTPMYYVEDNYEDLKEIRDGLSSHPSPAVQIDYFMKFGTYPMLGDKDI